MRLRDVKQGDRFVEHDNGRVALLEAIETAREIDDPATRRCGHECRARFVEGDVALQDANGIVTLFEAHDCGGYGLRLYPVPVAASSMPKRNPVAVPRHCETCATWALRQINRVPETPAYGYCSRHDMGTLSSQACPQWSARDGEVGVCPLCGR